MLLLTTLAGATCRDSNPPLPRYTEIPNRVCSANWNFQTFDGKKTLAFCQTECAADPQCTGVSFAKISSNGKSGSGSGSSSASGSSGSDEKCTPHCWANGKNNEAFCENTTASHFKNKAACEGSGGKCHFNDCGGSGGQR